MVDREKVIRRLEYVLDAMVQSEHAIAEDGVVMSSWQDRAKRIDAIREAIAFLKAQEPVAPVRKSFLVSAPGEYGTTPSMPVCGACGAWLLTVEPRAKHCPNCGRAVKWE